MTTNLKMAGAGLVQSPEIEQLRPCKYFGAGLCPNCYAESLLKLRKSTSTHTHKATDAKGLIRLGTYREILPADWEAFKAGHGTWDCCGAAWDRPDFQTRSYFLITRGLMPLAFYQEVAADPACVNIQVSTDLSPDGKATPGEEVIRELVKIPKVIFRAKTTPENAALWKPLLSHLRVQSFRIMETPLRAPGDGHMYKHVTPLETEGWHLQSYLRCNSVCQDCTKENGVMACAVRPATLQALPTRVRPAPIRETGKMPAVGWLGEMRTFLNEQGGFGTTAQAYKWFEARFPAVVGGRPNWKFRVRTALQMVGTKAPQGGWLSKGPVGQSIETSAPLPLRMVGLIDYPKGPSPHFPPDPKIVFNLGGQ